MDIRTWLTNLGLERYADSFEENEVTVEDLPDLTAADLKDDLGVKRLIDRKNLLAAMHDSATSLSETQQRIIDTYPILIARPFQELVEQPDIVRKSRTFVDVLTNTLKYLALVVETEYLLSNLRDEALNRLVEVDLGRPLVSAWHRFLRAALPFMAQEGHSPFIPELKPFYERVELKIPNRDKVKPPGSYYDDTGELVAKKSQGLGWVSALINYRNRFAHDANPPDEELQELYDFYYPVLESLLDAMGWAADYPLYKQEGRQLFSLMGTEPSPVDLAVPQAALATNLVMGAPGGVRFLKLVPFFIVPTDHFADSSDDLLVYDQSSGKRIIYVSPRGRKRETVRTIDLWRDLVAKKQIVEPLLTAETINADELATRCVRVSVATRVGLEQSRKVLKGLYYPRAEVEPQLRAWPGSIYPLLAVTSPAGGGKTNVLCHMAQEWSEEGATVLLLRSSHLEESDLMEVLRGRLRLDPALSAEQFVSAGTEAERRLLVVLDGLNEHARRTKLLASVVALCRKVQDNRHFKVVVSLRQEDTGWVEIEESDREQFFYDPASGGESAAKEANKGAMPPSLGVPVLSHAEREGMWTLYASRDSQRFKPRFSYANLYERSRSLAALLQNPLVLRLFLEVYAGQSMPKKITRKVVLDAYFDRLGQLTRDEGAFLLNLGRVLLENGSSTVDLDLLYEDARTKPVVEITGIGSAYHRLVEQGVLAEHREGESWRVGLSVEAVFEHLVGRILLLDGQAGTAQSLASCLETKSALEVIAGACRSTLTEQVERQGLGYLCEFIDVECERIAEVAGPVLGQVMLETDDLAEVVAAMATDPTEQDVLVAVVAAEHLAQQLDYKREVCFLSELLMALKAAIRGTNAHGKLLTRLGGAHRTVGDYLQALECYQKALAVRIKILGEEHPDVAESYDCIGTVLERHEEFTRALEYYEKSLATRIKTLGEEHPDVAASYYNISSAHDELTNYSLALEFLEKSLSIRIRLVGEEHSDVANCYNNIGIVHRRLGEYRQALEYYDKALAIRIKILGEEHPDVAESYYNIGVVHKRLGDHKRAVEFYEKSLVIDRRLVGEEHLNVAITYKSIAQIHLETGDYPKALGFFEKTLSIELSVMGDQHNRVARRYNNIAFIHGKLNNYARAVEFYEKSLGIYIENLSEQHTKVAPIYYKIGQMYSNLKDHEQALANFEKCLEIELKMLGEEHEEVTATRKKLAEVEQLLTARNKTPR